MGCGCSLGSSDRIEMQKKTKLPAMDDVFDGIQKFVDELYAIMDPFEESRNKLLEETGLDKVVWGNTHHATVGIIFALVATAKNVRVDDLFKTMFEPPFIEIDTSQATDKVAPSCKALVDYIKTIVDVKDRIEPLIQKSKEIAETAKDLPDKAKDEVKNAKDLGPLGMISAVKNTAINCKHMASLPSLLSDFKDLVFSSIEEIKGAVKELNDKKGKLLQIGKTCQSKKLVTPKECYLECGNKIEVKPEAKKKWEKESKKRQKAKK